MISRQSLVISASTTALALLLVYAGVADRGERAAAAPPPPPPPKGAPPAPVGSPPGPVNNKPVTTTTTTTITPPSLGTPTLGLGTFTDPSGQETSLNESASATLSNPFFHALGTNGRACASCHKEDQGWSITPAAIQALFKSTDGLDPLFSTVDGSNSPNAPVATLTEREAAYSELLNKGLIRIGLPIPSNAQFTLASVNDPYKFASASELSLFRRPLPATNLSFLSTVMFDGRFTVTGDSIANDLALQAVNAVSTHEQGTTTPTSEEIAEIVDFETTDFTAQSFDNTAGLLDINNADGGPYVLSQQPFTLGENTPFSASFTPDVFTIYDDWTALPLGAKSAVTPTAAEQSIARGEQIFDTRPFTISGVPGLNDVINRPSFVGTCTTCHNSTNVGDHSSVVYIDLGLTDPGRITPDLPQYTLKNKATGAIRVTSDPGRALVTGQWSDIGKFKVPTLRGLAARAPYFHNGFAPDVNSVIAFYNQRFQIGFSPQEQTDLANFLKSL